MLAFEANQNDVVNLEVSEDIQYQYAKNHINETVEALVEWLPKKERYATNVTQLEYLNW